VPKSSEEIQRVPLPWWGWEASFRGPRRFPSSGRTSLPRSIWCVKYRLIVGNLTLLDPRKGAPDKSYSKIGAFVEGSKKNRSSFVFSGSAPYIDCLQFMTLEAVHQAFVDAVPPSRWKTYRKEFPRKKTAVLIGNVEGENSESRAF